MRNLISNIINCNLDIGIGRIHILLINHAQHHHGRYHHHGCDNQLNITDIIEYTILSIFPTIKNFILAATITNTNNKTGQQKDLSDIVFTSCNEGNQAIIEVSKNTRYVSEKTTGNLDMAKQSYTELEDVTQKINEIHKTVKSFISTVDDLSKSSSKILTNVKTINDLSMPIYIDGNQWGCLIIGFDPRVMFED